MTYVIAEPGSTHDGSLEAMLGLVGLAKQIGADAVKFQWLSKAERLCARRRAPEYLDAYRTIQFPAAWLATLRVACEAHDIDFMCTSYLPEDVHVVLPLVVAGKIASFEASDPHFLALHAEWRKPVYVSTGMLATKAIADLGAVARRHFDEPSDVKFLHCVSAYPAPAEQMNLAVFRPRFYDAIRVDYEGLSDHSLHPWTGALAVAAGARVIEFHLRADDCDPANADYAVSRPPEAAREYVANIRLAETMLGDGAKRIMSAEEPWLRYAVPAASRGNTAAS